MVITKAERDLFLRLRWTLACCRLAPLR